MSTNRVPNDTSRVAMFSLPPCCPSPDTFPLIDTFSTTDVFIKFFWGFFSTCFAQHIIKPGDNETESQKVWWRGCLRYQMSENPFVLEHERRIRWKEGCREEKKSKRQRSCHTCDGWAFAQVWRCNQIKSLSRQKRMRDKVIISDPPSSFALPAIQSLSPTLQPSSTFC